MVKLNSVLSDDILNCSLKLEDGSQSSFQELIKNSRTTLVIFLRHFGCIGCTEHITEFLKRYEELKKFDVNVLIVGNGAPQFIAGFKERFSLLDREITIATDPSLKIYKMFELSKSLWGAMGVQAIAKAAFLFTRGMSQTSIEGDIGQQGGVALLDKNLKLVYFHQSRYLGDNAPMTDVISEVSKLYIHDNQQVGL